MAASSDKILLVDSDPNLRKALQECGVTDAVVITDSAPLRRGDAERNGGEP